MKHDSWSIWTSSTDLKGLKDLNGICFSKVCLQPFCGAMRCKTKIFMPLLLTWSCPAWGLSGWCPLLGPSLWSWFSQLTINPSLRMYGSWVEDTREYILSPRMYNECDHCYPDTSNDQVRTNKIRFMLPNLTMFSWICKICCASTYHNTLLSMFQKSAILTPKRLEHALTIDHYGFSITLPTVLPWYLQLDPGLRPWLGGSSSRWKNFGVRMQPADTTVPQGPHLSPPLGCVARQFLKSWDNSWSKRTATCNVGISFISSFFDS